MGMFYGSLRHTTTGRKKQQTTRRTRKVIKAVSAVSSQPYRRSTPEYRSVPDTVGIAPRMDSPRYTGTLVKGIGTMHKSNAVPIINEEEMKDIARMRR